MGVSIFVLGFGFEAAILGFSELVNLGFGGLSDKKEMAENRVAKRPSLGTKVRKRLSDITNLQSQSKFPLPADKETSPVISPYEKDRVGQLMKENEALMGLLAEKNKIIELTGGELRNLRISLQKLQLQNWSLAQSNSHILAELNLSKEKIKVARHELACKNALLMAKTLKQEEEKEVAGESLSEANNDKKPHKTSTRRPARSRSMGATSADQQVSGKEITENKRLCLRRQSARFEPQLLENSEDLFEIGDVKFQADQFNKVADDAAATRTRSLVQCGGRDCNYGPRPEAQESKRSSIGRPLRRAAEKVHSYKENPINIKMRRSE